MRRSKRLMEKECLVCCNMIGGWPVLKCGHFICPKCYHKLRHQGITHCPYCFKEMRR